MRAPITARVEDWARPGASAAGALRRGDGAGRGAACDARRVRGPLLRAGGVLVAWKGARDAAEERAGRRRGQGRHGGEEVAAGAAVPGLENRHLHVYGRSRPRRTASRDAPGWHEAAPRVTACARQVRTVLGEASRPARPPNHFAGRSRRSGPNTFPTDLNRIFSPWAPSSRVANQKGGVGKTTTAVNIGACVADAGYPTLLVDLDPQCNATVALGLAKDLDAEHLRLPARRGTLDRRRSSRPASSSSRRAVDARPRGRHRRASASRGSETRLREALGAVRDRYRSRCSTARRRSARSR